jgi:nematode chemoreceptor
MLQKDIIKNSCYKIMLLLGLLDMIAIPTDAIIPGIQTITGEHFCNNPIFNYVNGAVAMGKV